MLQCAKMVTVDTLEPLWKRDLCITANKERMKTIHGCAFWKLS